MPFMPEPADSPTIGTSGGLGLHQRLVARRLRFMDGRVSEYAADRQLRSLECGLAAYLGAIVLSAADVVCSVLSHGVAALVLVAVALTWDVACWVAFYRYGRAAALDIVRSQGLPDHLWRKVRANTPKRFDDWLSGVREEVAPDAGR